MGRVKPIDTLKPSRPVLFFSSFRHSRAHAGISSVLFVLCPLLFMYFCSHWLPGTNSSTSLYLSKYYHWPGPRSHQEAIRHLSQLICTSFPQTCNGKCLVFWPLSCSLGWVWSLQPSWGPCQEKWPPILSLPPCFPGRESCLESFNPFHSGFVLFLLVASTWPNGHFLVFTILDLSEIFHSADHFSFFSWVSWHQASPVFLHFRYSYTVFLFFTYNKKSTNLSA